MAKKVKSNSSGRSQANAPELQQMLSNQQPPHNPYYPDPAVIPPPPYTPTSVAISAAHTRMGQTDDIRYPRISHSAVTTPQSQTSARIVIQAPGAYDYRIERHRHKVRSFTNQTIVLAILSIVLAVWAYSLYDDRNCIDQFVVHKVNKDVEIRIKDVRQLHMSVAYASGFLIIICLLKNAIGFGGASHGCFLFIVGLFSFIVCVHNAYLAYLAFYSPCVTSLGDLSANAAKTFMSKFTDSLPTPDKGVFGESNVFEKANQDGLGLAIFAMDVMNTIFYFSIFLSSSTLC